MFTQQHAQTIWMLGVALSLGLLIGIERGWRARAAAAGARVAGVRTFGLLGLAGGIAGVLPPWAATIGLAAIAGLVVAGYWRESGGSTVSATNMLAALVTVLLGVVATTGHLVEATAAAVVTTLLLSAREPLHRWLRDLSEIELRSLGRFALIAFVLLPLLPDRAMGPLAAWNPRQLGMVIVLVSGLSFLGYLAVRRLGATRGLLVTALCGAIVSSTAVTVAFARRLNVESATPGPLIAGIALASMVMFIRVLLLTGVLAPAVLPGLAMLIVPALVVAVLLAALAYRQGGGSSDDESSLALGNPLELPAAFGLAALVAVLAVVSRWALDAYGGAGIAVVLGITGIADVDAAVITLAGLPPGAIDPRTAGMVLAVPVLLNTLFKAILAMVFAPGGRGLRAAAPLFASVAVAMLAGLALLR